MTENEDQDNKKGKVLFPFRAEKELLESGKALAAKRGMSLAALLRGLLIRELEASEKG